MRPGCDKMCLSNSGLSTMERSLTMSGKRKDKKGRVLRTREGQRKDLTYQIRMWQENGVPFTHPRWKNCEPRKMKLTRRRTPVWTWKACNTWWVTPMRESPWTSILMQAMTMQSSRCRRYYSSNCRKKHLSRVDTQTQYLHQIYTRGAKSYVNLHQFMKSKTFLKVRISYK